MFSVVESVHPQPPIVKSIFSTLFDTVAQRLHGEPKRDDDPLRLARVRQSMLALVGPAEGWEAEQLRHRVLVADSAKTLWFLRPALHQWLCQTQDEREAMVRVMALQPLFEGLVEPSLLGSSVGRRDRRGPFYGA